MDKLRYIALVALVILTSSAVAQPPAKPNPDDKAPRATPVATFGGHTTEVVALSLSADGKTITSVSTKDVRSWRADTGKEIASRKISWTDQGASPVFAIGSDGPGEQTLAAVEYRKHAESKKLVGNVVLFSATDGKELLAIDPHGEGDGKLPFAQEVAAMAFSPDGKHLATGGSMAIPGVMLSGAVKIWDAKTGKQLRRLGDLTQWDKTRADKFFARDVKLRPAVSTSAPASAVAYSADGKFIVAGTSGNNSELPEAGEVWIWNAADGKLVGMFTVADEVKAGGPDYPVTAVALSGDSKWVAAAVAVVPGRRDGPPPTEVRVWEVASGRAVRTLRGHTGRVARLAFSPDGNWLASAGGDKVVRLWSTRTGKEVVTFPFDTPQINAIAFSRDGRLLAAGGGDGKKSGKVRVWACPSE